MELAEYSIFQYVNFSAQNDSFDQKTNDEQSECGMWCRPNGRVLVTLFFYEGLEVEGGLFQWVCLNKPLTGITAE
jgi:hypothetical protein